jgi:hypothetical protein
MPALNPWTAKLGGLPHHSFMLWKPETLGSEFKNTGCDKTGVVMTLGVQSKNKTQTLRYNKEIRETMGVCLQFVEASDLKGGVKECLKCDAWFGSAQICVALGQKGYKVFLQIKGSSFK